MPLQSKRHGSSGWSAVPEWFGMLPTHSREGCGGDLTVSSHDHLLFSDGNGIVLLHDDASFILDVDTDGIGSCLLRLHQNGTVGGIVLCLFPY